MKYSVQSSSYFKNQKNVDYLIFMLIQQISSLFCFPKRELARKFDPTALSLRSWTAPKSVHLVIGLKLENIKQMAASLGHKNWGYKVLKNLAYKNERKLELR